MRPKDPYIGREFLHGQFRILQKIGTGGMGAVYKALQPDMNRMVAVKILHAKLKDRSDLVARFRREARAMSHLTHPNTVKVLLYGELDEGELYIVMEYLDGKNLNQMVRRDGPFPVERAIPILIQVCGALEEAHQQGIVHRDLKPENIFLTNGAGLTDYAKVLDFGLAKVTEREMRPGSIMLTQEGMVFGTPEFMSPEQAQGQILDRRSDIYSLAVILYETLTGKLPFDARSSMEYIQLHVMTQPIPLDQRLADKTFPPGLGDVIDRAMAKDRSLRYQSTAELAEALRPFAPQSFIQEWPPMNYASQPLALAVSPDSAREAKPGAREAKPGAREAKPGAREAQPAAHDTAQPAEPLGEAPTFLDAPVSRPPRQRINSTIVVVATVSVLTGMLLAVLALKLL
ncbi:MAG: serine/threonine protein kinase [Myxococcales bacterium]|nr:serine/threonine protein kinase [Myxococcales bacterium]